VNSFVIDVLCASEQPTSMTQIQCERTLLVSSADTDVLLFSADILCCIDACFTQKRRRGKGPNERDPLLMHHNSVFLPEEDVRFAEDLVNMQRPSRNRRTDTAHDEAPPTVPAAVLDECQKSFKAADENQQKASTKFFADTGLMALLCRHDRVLWLVNMVSAGERQHYAIALILRLFKHLPESVTVGILYDIGCQLHRSCEKWDFLGDYLPRIKFGISVFHAFGHQWPCQLLYHPRKCIGFGLTDGEGCKQFWSSIKKLIPVLRVSGVRDHCLYLRCDI
jgi:hypothetical protein